MIVTFFGLIVLVVAIDLATKFSFDGVLNPGIAWSLGADLPWLWIVVTAVSLILVVVLLAWFWYKKQRTWLWTVGLALFIGGVLGNAIDRLISHGPVHDFINFVIFKNNLADIALCVGTILIMLDFIRGEKRAV